MVGAPGVSISVDTEPARARMHEIAEICAMPTDIRAAAVSQ